MEGKGNDSTFDVLFRLPFMFSISFLYLVGPNLKFQLFLLILYDRVCRSVCMFSLIFVLVLNFYTFPNLSPSTSRCVSTVCGSSTSEPSVDNTSQNVFSDQILHLSTLYTTTMNRCTLPYCGLAWIM